MKDAGKEFLFEGVRQILWYLAALAVVALSFLVFDWLQVRSVVVQQILILSIPILLAIFIVTQRCIQARKSVSEE